MIHDRVGDINLRLTQELIASRVGARRAGVTVAAGHCRKCEQSNTAEVNSISFIGKPLEAVVCECYSTMRAEFRKNEAEFIQVHSLSEK